MIFKQEKQLFLVAKQINEFGDTLLHFHIYSTNTKISYRPIAQQTFSLNAQKNHNFKSVNVKDVPKSHPPNLDPGFFSPCS